MENHGYSEYETQLIGKLRSVAYCMGYVQFQMDDIKKEIDFTKEFNTSRKNAFSHELRLRVILFGDNVRSLQNAVSNALTPCRLKRTKRLTAPCVMQNVLSSEKKEWIHSQLTLSEMEKRVTSLEFDNLALALRFSNVHQSNKLLRLKRLLHFTMEKQHQILHATSCSMSKKTSDELLLLKNKSNKF